MTSPAPAASTKPGDLLGRIRRTAAAGADAATSTQVDATSGAEPTATEPFAAGPPAGPAADPEPGPDPASAPPAAPEPAPAAQPAAAAAPRPQKRGGEGARGSARRTAAATDEAAAPRRRGPRANKTTFRFTLDLTQATHRALRMLSLDTGVYASDLLRAAIEELTENEEMLDAVLARVPDGDGAADAGGAEEGAVLRG